MILFRITIFILLIFIVSCGKEELKQTALIEVDSEGPSILGTAKELVATYKGLTASSVATEGKISIKHLHQSVRSYYTRYGSMPGDCYEEMESRGAIEMPQRAIDAWEFECDWEFDEGAREVTGQITATSTESNDAGPGKQIIYDIYTGEYSGYGQGDEGE